jgi:hypothetical protein
MNEHGLPVAEFRKTFILPILVMLIPGLPALLIIAVYELEIPGLVGMATIGWVTIVVVANCRYRLTVYEKAILEKGILRSKLLRFHHCTKFFHRAVQQTIESIPAGKHIFITADDGHTRIKLNSNIKDILKLRALLIEKELNFVMPSIQRSYEDGCALDFEAIKLHRGILQHGKKSLFLNEIARMTLDGGFFRIYAHGQNRPTIKLELGKIANMHTLFQLLQKLTPPSSQNGDSF